MPSATEIAYGRHTQHDCSRSYVACGLGLALRPLTNPHQYVPMRLRVRLPRGVSVDTANGPYGPHTPLRGDGMAFSFFHDYETHDRFAVTVWDGQGSHTVEVRAWGNTMGMIRNYVESGNTSGIRNVATKALASIYRTGYASVHGVNYRVTALAA